MVHEDDLLARTRPPAGVPQRLGGVAKQAPRCHAPLAYCAVKVGHLMWLNAADHGRSLSNYSEADASVSRLPTIAASEQCAAADPA